MSFFEYLAWGISLAFAVYLAARLISAAFFKSKRQYESEKQNGRS